MNSELWKKSITELRDFLYRHFLGSGGDTYLTEKMPEELREITVGGFGILITWRPGPENEGFNAWVDHEVTWYHGLIQTQGKSWQAIVLKLLAFAEEELGK